MDDERELLLDGWEAAASGWARQADSWAETIAPLTERMLDLAELRPGVRVVELAAGPGDLALKAAERVAPTKVLCTDAVEAMVEAARERAVDEGVENVEFQRLQLEWIDLPAGSVDVILCRFGVMLTVDPEAAVRECRRVLAPGGRLVLAVWDQLGRNPWMMVPTEAALGLGFMQPTEPGGPGPFALSAPGRLAGLLDDVGFFDVSVEPVALEWSYRNDLAWLGEKLDHSPAYGAMWKGLRDGQRAELRAAVRERAEPYADPDGTLRPTGQALVAVAHA